MQRKKKTGKKGGEEEEGKKKRGKDVEGSQKNGRWLCILLRYQSYSEIGLTKKQDYNTQIKMKSSDAVSFNNLLILKELNM